MLPGTLFGAEDPKNLIIGYTESAYNGVSSADVKASVNILLQKIALTHFNKGEVHFYTKFSDIATALMVISRRDKLLQGVIAVNGRLSTDFKKKTRQSFLSLPGSVQGQQLLMLFKISDILPFIPGSLQATEDLYAEHFRLNTISR
ncbi:hypothetical protein FCL47_13375 [Desulfopila sp. IMCC35006]|uniref:hypothetical protein n=1 Tax=Desulfopila sp. IMCC35006 TaxID=2569542 RepID=UPI00113F63BA|nr:hypothetical protein [Desulfopila sp. IMCC35006]TKB25527.1 hypothetical protein FCL47_13375 [Desulfopila sp. IMCC35006]